MPCLGVGSLGWARGRAFVSPATTLLFLIFHPPSAFTVVTAQRPTSRSSLMPWRKPVKFLLVDDLEENLTALVALLARDGLELHTARSGAEALELLLHHEFALALLDVQMPEMNGFELAELMRGTARTRHIPIIFLTAVATDDSLRFRGYEAGAVDYLLKPLDSQMLKNKTDVFFELARQKLELAWQRDQLR